ncbi:MAG: polysaccharide deacetylase family protein [Bacteroidales bacterium]|nr:polysaccharide deacetylase family protein [Bacteroidales bacterium]
MNNYINNKLIAFFVKTNGFFSRKLFSGLGHIITLHRVIPESDFLIPENKALEITPDFLKHLVIFYRNNNYEFVTLDTLYDVLTGKKKISRRIAVLTFDDGYKDVYTHAYPLLKALEIPMNLYITTSFPDKTAFMWWFLIEQLLKGKEFIRINIDGENKKIACSTSLEKQEAFKHIRMLILNNYINYQQILKQIFLINDVAFIDNTEELSLTWEQIKQMSTDPLVNIAAHTVNHPIFNRITETEIINEVISSKTIIEQHINKKVSHFAYPYGGKDEVGIREFDILKELGFKTCSTTRFSNIFSGHRSHLACLPRIQVGMHMVDEKLKNLEMGITQFSKNKFNRIVTL